MTYEAMLKQLDMGRLPVVVFYRADRSVPDSEAVNICYYATSYSVASWSPILTGDQSVRNTLLAQAIAATAGEAIRNDPDL